ncbi:MAG: Holliday junction branch migration protein RuvA [Chlorobiales bacterium]|nr:Holliday junction branch migration protein RuvA [Chlorobiales bacterium]
MLSYLVGKLAEKSSSEAVLEVNGVGYLLSISATTHELLPALGEDYKILCYLHVREDALQLFGFATEEERQVFKLLLTISGVGPKLAQTILSGMDAARLREAIVSNNTKSLTAIAGVGKKTADRIVLELRDKVMKLDLKSQPVFEGQSAHQQARSDAYSALLSLGFSRPAAEKAMRSAIAELPNGSADELIRIALKYVQNEK